jgi:hypothetical protein
MVAMKQSPALALLLERLHWPIPRVRWEAARQVAGLIAAGDQAARDALLSWASRQHLECDALMVPSLVHSFDLVGVYSFNDLNAAVQAPSLLSDALLLKLYPGNEQRLPPSRFRFASSWGAAASRGFEDGLGTVVPLIFKSALETEQDRSDLPFLGRWKAEWSELQRLFPGPYTNYPGFFLGGDRGCTTRADLKLRAVYVSAFLRTLSYAHVVWKMPRELASVAAELALPFNEGLSKFSTSTRPRWSLRLLERVEKVGPPIVARKLWRGAAATLPKGFEPIALDVTDYDGEKAVRIEMQRVIQGRGPDGVPVRSLGHPPWVTIQPRRYSMEGFLTDSVSWTEEGGLIPVTVVAHPVALGRAHIDVSIDRLQFASPYLARGSLRITCRGDRINAEDDDGLLSTLRLWYSNWQPTHPEEFTPVGHLTACRSTALREFKSYYGVDVPRLARVRTARRAHSYEPFNTNETTYRL